MAEVVTIQLDIASDLKFNDDGSVGLNITSEVPDRLSIKEDGLYIEAPVGKSKQVGMVFGGQYDNEGLRVGANCPFGRADNPDIEAPLMITCTEKVHRVFESSDPDGQNLVGFRPNIDCVLPGDMYRVAVFEIDGEMSSGIMDEPGSTEDIDTENAPLKRQQIVAAAAAYVGKDKATALGYETKDDWCARFVYRVITEVGIEIAGTAIDGDVDVPNTYVTYLWKNLKKTNKWKDTTDPPIPGDVITFDRDPEVPSERPLDHVGIIENYDKENNIITYIDGNHGGAESVTRYDINADDKTIAYITRYTG